MATAQNINGFPVSLATIWIRAPNRENSRREHLKFGLDKYYFALALLLFIFLIRKPFCAIFKINSSAAYESVAGEDLLHGNIILVGVYF